MNHDRLPYPCLLDMMISGGVVVISHHAEFTGALCNETWTVADGRLSITKVEPKEGTAKLKLDE
jgi:ATPase subunit of ABC transporter with duplicated ATPase domains